MGQQQLLLLVLATVIVGLATVAGIQAFDENRNQAAADALNQKAAELAADVKGIYEKPEQFGGLPTNISENSSASEIAAKLGIDNSTGVEVPTAEGDCKVNKTGAGPNGVGNGAVSIKCTPGTQVTSSQFSGLNAVYGVFEPGNDPEVYVQDTNI